MARKTKTESLNGSTDDEDDIGFVEGEINIGTPVAFFNFAPPEEEPAAPASSKGFKFYTPDPTKDNLTDNRRTKVEPNYATPRAGGESYTVGRFYKLRYSTAKMLNEIKASHRNVNVYMNTLVDEAIRYYYLNAFKQE